MKGLAILVVALVSAVGLVRAQGQRQDQSPVQGSGGQPDPCQTKTRVVGDLTYCDRYWECVNGQPQLYDCPNGLVFIGRNRGIAEGCDYPWRGNYCVNKQTANPPIGTAHCEWLYGIFGHETSCTRYWTCWNGTATEQFCIGGLLYNEDTHACDWPENVRGCQKHPLCKDDPNANVPLGKSCERYWACQGGYPRLQRCPATLVFHRDSHRCVAPPTPECAVPSTTPRPKKDPQQARQGGGQSNRQNQFQGQNQLQGQSQSPPRRQQNRRPVSQRGQQQNQQSRPQPQPQPLEEELPPQEQFVDEVVPSQQDNFQPPPPPPPPRQQVDQQDQPRRPQTPRRPQFSSGPQLPFNIPGATPIQFSSSGQFTPSGGNSPRLNSPRIPPIPGATQIRFN